MLPWEVHKLQKHVASETIRAVSDINIKVNTTKSSWTQTDKTEKLIKEEVDKSLLTVVKIKYQKYKIFESFGKWST